MNLSEVIAAYGDELQFQNLDECTISLNMGKGVTKITFGTEQPIHGFNGMEKLGLVIWMDRKRVKDIIVNTTAALSRPEGSTT